METAFQNETPVLNAAIRGGIKHMKRLGFSIAQIGEEAGYALQEQNGSMTCAMINKIMSEDTVLPNALALKRLSKWFSKYGFDELADEFSDDAKMNVTVKWEIDGCMSNELRDIIQGAGIGSAAFESDDEHTAREWIKRLVAAALGAQSEFNNKFRQRRMAICGDGQ